MTIENLIAEFNTLKSSLRKHLVDEIEILPLYPKVDTLIGDRFIHYGSDDKFYVYDGQNVYLVDAVPELVEEAFILYDGKRTSRESALRRMNRSLQEWCRGFEEEGTIE